MTTSRRHLVGIVFVIASLTFAGTAMAQGSDSQLSREQLQALHAAADRGDGQTQAYLGFIYQTGQGVPVDLEKAVEFYRKAAASGSAEGYAQLGWVYSQGLGVPL